MVILSGAVMGCCLGFLVFNLPPARVFMGDSGSHFLGIALGAITILGVAKIVVGLSILVPLIALGLPIGDTLFAIVRRALSGQNPAKADAGHLHHRLRAVGLNPIETAVTFYLVHRDPRRMPGAHHLRTPPRSSTSHSDCSTVVALIDAHSGETDVQGSAPPFRGGH